MSYQAIITKLKNVRPHPNADRVLLAAAANSQVVVGLNNYENEIGIFFGDDGCLSQEMAYTNNLFDKSELNIDTKKTGYFGKNARIRAQKFRGEKSYGFWIELPSVAWTGVDLNELKNGFTFTHLNGKEVCKKYINPATLCHAQQNKQNGPKSPKKLSVRFAYLKTHMDTRQLRYEIEKIPKGSIFHFTEKCHGSSGRTGRVFAEVLLTPKKEWWNKYFGWINVFEPAKTYQYVSGSRRVVLDPTLDEENRYYSGNTFRVDIHKKIKEAGLPKGTELFYEIVGYTETGSRIMPSQSIEKIEDKKLRKLMKKKYGEVMTYSYGCEPDTEPTNLRYDVYVYRASTTNENGNVVELSWPNVKQLCSTIGLKHVPDLREPLVYDGDDEALLEITEGFLDKDSTIDARHITEGVCVRIEPPEQNMYILKDKGFGFKNLEGIVKSNNQIIDTEEAEDLAADGEE